MVTIYVNRDNLNKDESNQKQKAQTKIDKRDGNLSGYTYDFLEIFDNRRKKKSSQAFETIQVSEVLGKLARLYERIRNTVEYKGEHVLRRNAIERILKRLIWEQESVRVNVDPTRVTETLLKELIWARYLPNKTVPKEKEQVVKNAINKYLYVLKNIDKIHSDVKTSKVKDWFWGIASAEIEDIVDPSNRDLYVNLMYGWFLNYFEWQNKGLSDHEKQIQLYLATHRAYTKSDDAIMRYYLLLKEYPNWQDANQKEIDDFIKKFPQIYKEIERNLNYDGRYALFRIVQKQLPAFDIFRTIAEDKNVNLTQLLKSKKSFNRKIIKVCSLKYEQIRSRVNTGIVRSIIYIFITKVMMALIIEVPFEIYWYGDVRYTPLGINILLPPLLMFLIGLSTRIPGEENTKEIIKRLNSVVYKTDSDVKQAFSIRQTRRRTTLGSVFAFLYLALFILVFGGLGYLLLKINFTLFGIIIFFGFLSLVLLFAFRVRFNANELKVKKEDESAIGHLISYLTLPFLNIGFYLSKGFEKLSFLTIILDFIIEAPLKSIIDIFEEWTSFLREKKEEVVEIPE
jgi:hypothetical protein